MTEQTGTQTTPVVLLPSGNIAYKMPCWWREIGPDGKDYGNLPVLPKGAVRMVPAPQPAPDIRAQAIEVGSWVRPIPHRDEFTTDLDARNQRQHLVVEAYPDGSIKVACWRSLGRIGTFPGVEALGVDDDAPHCRNCERQAAKREVAE